MRMVVRRWTKLLRQEGCGESPLEYSVTETRTCGQGITMVEYLRETVLTKSMERKESRGREGEGGRETRIVRQ